MRRTEIAAALQELQEQQVRQLARFGELASVLQNLAPIVEAWQQEAAETQRRLAAIERSVKGRSWFADSLQRLRARWRKTAAQAPTGE